MLNAQCSTWFKVQRSLTIEHSLSIEQALMQGTMHNAQCTMLNVVQRSLTIEHSLSIEHSALSIVH
jgi:hypothetical protein